MSEPSEESSADVESGPLAGARLAAARRDQDVSLADVARELHLDEGKVQALEQNQFEVLGAPVFAKGHLRKYAQLVGIAVDDILADYYRLNRSTGAPPVVGPPRKRSREIDLTRWILPVAIVLALGAAVIFWISAGSPLPSFGSIADPGADIEFAAPVPVANDGADDIDEGSVPDGDGIPALPAVEPASPAGEQGNAATEPAEAIDTAPAPASEEIALTLTFRGDCWTEVTDASGTRLFFDLGREGSRIAVTGTPPLRLLFGDYANVDVEVDGSAYPIPASALRGETARFTINAR